MSKWLKYFSAAIFCVAIFLQGRAQDLDSLPSVFMQDTVYETTVSSNENYQFQQPPAPTKIFPRRVSDAELNKLKSDEDYWYINQLPPRQREMASPPVNEKGEKQTNRSRGIFNIRWLNVLFWIVLIAGFLALLVWFLKTSDIHLFRKKARVIDEKVEEDVTEDIFEMNFEREIQKATDAKNYRLAVRLMYLRTLRDLSHHILSIIPAKRPTVIISSSWHQRRIIKIFSGSPGTLIIHGMDNLNCRRIVLL